jgi:hypothetical protein
VVQVCFLGIHRKIFSIHPLSQVPHVWWGFLRLMENPSSNMEQKQSLELIMMLIEARG